MLPKRNAASGRVFGLPPLPCCSSSLNLGVCGPGSLGYLERAEATAAAHLLFAALDGMPVDVVMLFEVQDHGIA